MADALAVLSDDDAVDADNLNMASNEGEDDGEEETSGKQFTIL